MGYNQQEEFFRRQNNKERWGHSEGPIDAVAHSLFKFLAPFIIPIILIYIAIQFIAQYWVYIVSVGIAVVCVIICKNIYRRTTKPELKIAITVLVSITLIVTVLVMPRNSDAGEDVVQGTDTGRAQATFMFVNADALNVREGPSTSHDVLGQLTRDTRVQVLDSSGQWWRIKLGNVEGFVYSEYLIKEKASPTSTTSPKASTETSSTPVVRESWARTTRDPEFQRVYEEARAN